MRLLRFFCGCNFFSFLHTYSQLMKKKAPTLCRIVFLLLFISLFPTCCWAAENSAIESELVGTWRIDTNLLHHQVIPTNFLSFALTLKSDGSFLATNVPADLFFDYTPTPAFAEAQGSWKLKPDSSDGTDKLFLDFAKPNPGYWSSFVQMKFSGIPFFSRVARRYIYMGYHSGKKDELVFYLIQRE